MRNLITLIVIALFCAVPIGAGEANVLVNKNILRAKSHACTQQVNQQTFTSSQTWVVPTNVTNLQVVAGIGGGGGGGNGAQNAGGGAQYAEKDNLAVTPGNNVTITIGAGGNGGASSASGQSGAAGGNTTVIYNASTVIQANGGGGGGSSGGAGGTGGIGATVLNNGGAGGFGGNGGKGGGGAGGPHGVGGTGGNSVTSPGPPYQAGAGGAGDAGFGGAGGAGSDTNNGVGGNGGNGTEFGAVGSGGGGGGGAGGTTLSAAGGTSGNYGAGGATPGFGQNGGVFLAGSAGASGVVVLRYTLCGNAPPPLPPQNTFFVATNGSDTNAGTLTSPFLTLGACQSAMRNSATIKTCTLRAGTYSITTEFDFTSADNGETWQYYTADGLNTAILNGNGINRVVNGTGISNVTWNGIRITNFANFGIEFQGGGTGDVIENSEVDTGTGNTTPADAVSCSGVPNCSILHNYVHDIVSFGIAVYAFNATDSANGDIVDSNVCIRCNTGQADTGAIYSDMHFSGVNGGHVTISNNYVSEWGGSPGNQHAIYLDDSDSNVTVVGNVIAPPQGVTSSNKGGTSAIFVHNGEFDTIKNNIIDVGNTGFVVTVNWSFDATSANTTMQGNVFSNNIQISIFTGTQSITQGQTSGAFSFVQNASSGHTFLTTWVSISNDAYYNYSTGTVNTTGNVTSDSSPQLYNATQVGVSCTGGVYTIVAASTVTGAPVNFPQIVGGWGPPGFVLPGGLPHSC